MTLRLVLALAACSPAPEPPAGENAAPPGIERDVYERLWLERFCGAWEICADGAPCPYLDGASVLPERCAYDANAAQACIVGRWECVAGSGYPVGPPECDAVCGGETTITTF